jgi:hypothetical protein
MMIAQGEGRLVSDILLMLLAFSSTNGYTIAKYLEPRHNDKLPPHDLLLLL